VHIKASIVRIILAWIGCGILVATAGLPPVVSAVQIERAPTNGLAEVQAIAWGKTRTYLFGDWKYVFTITHNETRSEGRCGALFCNGENILDLQENREGDEHQTPWRKIIWNGCESALRVPKGGVLFRWLRREGL
jgi:hypothetical protein